VDTFLGLGFLFILSAVSWFYVLSKRARSNYLKTGRDQSRMGKEQDEMREGAFLAGALVVALTFSIFFLFFFIVAIVNLFH
jgi:hypothetical protein